MRVLVAMSGGIDSAVTALLLKRQGHEVVGMTLRVHDDPERQARAKSCCAPRDMMDAREVALMLGIPYYAVDVREAFHEKVIRPFAKDYLEGRTPSPCVICNSQFKFGLLFQRAKALGFQYVATGHYARKLIDPNSGRAQLLRGVDRQKDQSYFLFALSQEQLECAQFPLGDLTKSEVRAIARENGIPIAEKPESQEICFVASGSYAGVVEKVMPEVFKNVTEHAGVIKDESGKSLGAHPGIHHFTVGQRRGLGVSAPQPLYVTKIDPTTREVRIAPEAALYRQEITIERVSWFETPGHSSEVAADVAIRYRHAAAPARLKPSANNQWQAVFTEAQRAVAPGQAAVFYRGEQVLGGGWIA